MDQIFIILHAIGLLKLDAYQVTKPVGSYNVFSILFNHASITEIGLQDRAGFRQGWALGPCTIWAPQGQTKTSLGLGTNAVFTEIQALFNLALQSGPLKCRLLKVVAL